MSIQITFYIHRLIRIQTLLLTVLAIGVNSLPAARDDDRPRPPNPGLVQIEDEPGLPRVLIIGDSISIGYTLATRDLLRGVANVHRIPENGGSTDRGLDKLETWLETGNPIKGWDVIHFNWGLHDLKHAQDGKLDLSAPQENSPEQYAENLRKIVDRLKQTGAQLIFATTTPVPEGADGRVAGDEIKFNAAALEVMRENDIMINDLHAWIAPQIESFQLNCNVHFRKPEGNAVLAQQVAAKIREGLAIAQPALVEIEDVPGLPRVLLIGDSISIGYTLAVRERLKGIANVHRIPRNGGPTDRGLENLEDWLDTGTPNKGWDLIHFNWGIHDLKRVKEGKKFTGPNVNPPAEYVANLATILSRLEQTDAKLIFATTTPIPAGAFRCTPGDEVIFNAAAVDLMKSHGVAVNDLHAWIEPYVGKLQRPENVHFTPGGSEKLAEKVAVEIKQALETH